MVDNSQPDPNRKKATNKPDSNIDAVYDDGPGDTTVRPAGPEILLHEWPRPQLPKREPPPPENK